MAKPAKLFVPFRALANRSIKRNMKNVVFKDYGMLEIYENFVVAKMKEGITVKVEYNEDLVTVAQKYFKDKRFGYITHRKNSYSVDPRVYFETSKIENLVAFAVVTEHASKGTTVALEKEFIKKPFKVFHDIEIAKSWVLSKVSEG